MILYPSEHAKAEEIRQLLERQKEQQRQQHSETLVALQEELEAAKTEKFALTEEKNRLAVQIEQLKSELEKKVAQLAATAEKLDSHEKKAQAEERVKTETQALTEQTSRQLEACSTLKNKMRETLMSRLKKMVPESAAAADKVPATSAYVGTLEKHNKELQTALQVRERWDSTTIL